MAGLVPSGKVLVLVLVLNLLRWGDEVKTLEGLDLPAAGVKGAKVTATEMKIAEQLVGDMSSTAATKKRSAKTAAKSGGAGRKAALEKTAAKTRKAA
ncbi:hypothetical protein [Rhizobium leguminosarum]|uniref:hypothetical protein n=1 Tax=Rhizobium leguminosarum TaxID=384 RepID=UPI001952D4C2|nr:hypothetical protein [Rhizobium leguminosarum]